MSNSYFFLLLFQALLLSTATMLVAWFFALRARNAGIVDWVWSGLFALIALVFGFLGDGYGPRRALIAGMVFLWSLRLTGFLFLRFRREPKEDPRYLRLRQSWGESAELRFLGLFQLQALVLVLLTAPLALACLNTDRSFSAVEWVALALWLIGMVGEALADRQLEAFRAQAGNHGKTCEEGLWKYSRHPNYFFDWLIWCAFFLFALGSPWGWVTLYCPVLMFSILTRVTGIPLAEEQALHSRGESYLRYQKRTNAFFPWFPKKV